jgi:hypothetical protein
MGEFTYQVVEDTAKELYIRALKILPPDVHEALKEGTKRATLEHPFRGSSTHPVTRVNPQTSVGEEATQETLGIEGLNEKIAFLKEVASDWMEIDKGKAKSVYHMIYHIVEKATL